MDFKTYKSCRTCSRTLSLKRFPKNKDPRKKLGYTIKSECYDCHANRNRLWYYANYEYNREKDRQYRIKHRKLKNIYNRKYRKQFKSPTYKKEDMQPRVDFTTPSPSPEEWESVAYQKLQKIEVKYGVR